MESRKRTMQVFTIAFCIVISVLAFFFNYKMQERGEENSEISNVVYENDKEIKQVLPTSAYEKLPKQTEKYLSKIGYQFKDEVLQVRVIESSIEVQDRYIVFRCFYGNNDINMLVVSYDVKKDRFDFFIEEQKE